MTHSFRPVNIASVFRGLPENGNGDSAPKRLPGGVAAAMAGLVRQMGPSALLLSFAGDPGKPIDRIVCQNFTNTKVLTTLHPQIVQAGYGAVNKVFWPWAHDMEEWLKDELGIVYEGLSQDGTLPSWTKEMELSIEMNRHMSGQILSMAHKQSARHVRLLNQDYQLFACLRRCASAARGGWSYAVLRARRPHLMGEPSRVASDELLGPIRHGCTGGGLRGLPHQGVAAKCHPSGGEAAVGDVLRRLRRCRSVVRRRDPARTRGVKLIVQPINIDGQLWQRLSREGTPGFGLPAGVAMVLSVERRDYTKTSWALRMIRNVLRDVPRTQRDGHLRPNRRALQGGGGGLQSLLGRHRGRSARKRAGEVQPRAEGLGWMGAAHLDQKRGCHRRIWPLSTAPPIA